MAKSLHIFLDKYEQGWFKFIVEYMKTVVDFEGNSEELSKFLGAFSVEMSDRILITLEKLCRENGDLFSSNCVAVLRTKRAVF